MRSFFSLAAAVAFTGCAVPAEQSADSDGTQGAAAELSTTTETFVSIRRDTRECLVAGPGCGGYYVKDVNSSAAEHYVYKLDFSSSGLSDADVAKITSAPTSDIILKGKLSNIVLMGYHSFFASAGYRGLPGVVPAAGALFYSANDRVPAINCFAAPCNNELAHKLNAVSSNISFTTLSVDHAALSFVDKNWLKARVLENGALVAGTFVNGAHEAAGYEKVLDASQIYLRIPDHVGICSHREIFCAQGTVETFVRDANRCLSPQSCVTPGICPLFIPACAQGYTLSSWRTNPNGCSAYACDPSFIHP